MSRGMGRRRRGYDSMQEDTCGSEECSHNSRTSIAETSAWPSNTSLTRLRGRHRPGRVPQSYFHPSLWPPRIRRFSRGASFEEQRRRTCTLHSSDKKVIIVWDACPYVVEN